MAAGMMPAISAFEDVVYIRLDTSRVVQDFLAQLAAQAAEGETRAPANPANRAVFRELAPFRLVEYAYVCEDLPFDSVHVGFPDGSIYSVTDEIPEAVVDDLVRGDPATLAPMYLYVLLERACPTALADEFLDALAIHLDRPLVGARHDGRGAVVARIAGADGTADLADEAARCEREGDRHLSRRQVLDGYRAKSQAVDGRAWAQVCLDYTRHVLEFASAADRDDFVAWTQALCRAVEHGRWRQGDDVGFLDAVRPAEVACQPVGEVRAIPLDPPAKMLDGRPWLAFGGVNAVSDAQALAMVREYWEYCRQAVAEAAPQPIPAAG